jgi:hypothetical protein
VVKPSQIRGKPSTEWPTCLIAVDNYKKIQQLVEKRDRTRKTIRRSTGDADSEANFVGQMNNIIESHTLIVIIFCAAALKAYINDYAINRLSKGYLENHLDKLDLASKCIVISQLITSKQLDKSAKWFSDLSWLIALRNKLVHYKTRVRKIDEIAETDFLWETDAKKALKTFKNCVFALKKIDKRLNTRWLEHYYSRLNNV